MGRVVQTVPPPSAPTNLTVTNISYARVGLWWGIPTSGTVLGYHIYDTNGNLKGTTTGRTENSIIIENLIPETTYNFFVVAIGPNDTRSPRSNTVLVRTNPRMIDTTRAQEDAVAHAAHHAVRALMFEQRFDQVVWDNATPTEREDILNDFFTAVNLILGMTPQRPLAFGSGLGGTGRYCFINRNVTISQHLLRGTDSEDLEENREIALTTIIHEARHEFQHQAILNHYLFRVSIETRNWWRDDFNGLFPLGGHDNLGDYFALPSEWMHGILMEMAIMHEED